jgi:hypothetical protein
MGSECIEMAYSTGMAYSKTIGWSCERENKGWHCMDFDRGGVWGCGC